MKTSSQQSRKHSIPPIRKLSATASSSGSIRPDGRGLDEIRPIWCEVGFSPRAHGSGIFTRGETQVLTLATLGTPKEAQELDSLTPDDSKRYMHHYNFPPYSTGEVKMLRGSFPPGNRPRRSG